MLDDEKKAAVAKWVAEGASLDAIQKRIKSEWGIHLTYLDVRMLVAELPQPQEPEEEKVPEEENKPAEAPEGDGEAGESPQGEGEDDAQGAAGVSLAFDAVVDPRYLASGTVTFSDGKGGKWILDQYGRFGLAGLPEGYQPSSEDAREFQMKLVSELRARGMA